MKRLILIAALAACDDPEVTGKVSSVLEHGIVEAQADCYCTLTGPSNYSFSARYQKLIDGSCLVLAPGSGGTVLIARSEEGAPHCESGSPDFDIYDGLIHGPDGYSDADITTCCTGFNLEAFGVTP